MREEDRELLLAWMERCERVLALLVPSFASDPKAHTAEDLISVMGRIRVDFKLAPRDALGEGWRDVSITPATSRDAGEGAE
jgi:hypothetical protein